MALKVPDLLQYELRHRLEQWRGALERWGLRRWIDQHFGGAIVVACLSVGLLGFVLIRTLWPVRPGPVVQSRLAWFCDANTGRLFTDSSMKAGPIPAPSGPLPDGGHAGFRAHVYSYALKPNESGLFVGFLERPDPSIGAKAGAYDVTDVQAWAQGRLIRRVKDDRWVAADSAQGQAILRELLKPDARGRTPVYQWPRSK